MQEPPKGMYGIGMLLMRKAVRHGVMDRRQESEPKYLLTRKRVIDSKATRRGRATGTAKTSRMSTRQ